MVEAVVHLLWFIVSMFTFHFLSCSWSEMWLDLIYGFIVGEMLSVPSETHVNGLREFWLLIPTYYTKVGIFILHHLVLSVRVYLLNVALYYYVSLAKKRQLYFDLCWIGSNFQKCWGYYISKEWITGSMFALFLGSWNNNRIFTILTFSNVLIYSRHVGCYFKDFMSYTSLLQNKKYKIIINEDPFCLI